MKVDFMNAKRVEPTDLTSNRVAKALSHVHGRRIGVETPGSEGVLYSVRDVSANSLVEMLNCSATRGVWRVTVDVVDQYENPVGPLSLVYKELQKRGNGPERWLAQSGRESPYYWGREARIGKLLEKLDGPLRAPRSVSEKLGKGLKGVWFEDLGTAIPGEKWEPSRYLLAAYHLGEMQGGFLVDPAKQRVLSKSKKLARDWLQEYLRRAEGEVASALDSSELWARSDVTKAFGDSSLEDSARLWDQRHASAQVLRALPQTLCHQDFWPGQLFAVPGGNRFNDTMVIDWAFAGVEAIGTDAANLVIDSATDGLLRVPDIADMWNRAKQAYVDGLSAAGWSGDERLVELGMTAGAAAKWSWFRPLLVVSAENDSTWSEWAERWQQDPAAAFDSRADVLEFVERLPERSAELQRELHMEIPEQDLGLVRGEMSFA